MVCLALVSAQMIAVWTGPSSGRAVRWQIKMRHTGIELANHRSETEHSAYVPPQHHGWAPFACDERAVQVIPMISMRPSDLTVTTVFTNVEKLNFHFIMRIIHGAVLSGRVEFSSSWYYPAWCRSRVRIPLIWPLTDHQPGTTSVWRVDLSFYFLKWCLTGVYSPRLGAYIKCLMCLYFIVGYGSISNVRKPVAMKILRCREELRFSSYTTEEPSGRLDVLCQSTCEQLFVYLLNQHEKQFFSHSVS